MKFPFERQPDGMDCGPACIKMVSAFYKKRISLDTIRKKCYITREGVSFLGLSEGADALGFRTLGVKITLDMLASDVPLPCIVHWRQKHFVVIYKISGDKIWVADPAVGLIKYDVKEFIRNWSSTTIDGKPAGLVLIIEPTPSLFKREDDDTKQRGFSFLFKYFKLYKKYFFQLALGLLLGSMVQLIIPFLTRSVIDIGINNDDLNFIYLILFAQLTLIIGRMSVEFIRGWLLLHIGTRVNVAIVSGFLQKLMSLPVAFFDTKLTGDILQRIQDNIRIEEFLTSASLTILFSFFNIVIFSIVLAVFSPVILSIFLAGAILYATWIALFMKPREILDIQRFKKMSAASSKVINIVNGMQEIKLTQSELAMRWDWESTQAGIFTLKTRGLRLIQYQTAGSTFINEVMNLVITIVAAASVLKGNMTLGTMLAIQFIIGQLNVPLSQVTSFFKMAQDARLSLDRLAEIHEMENEESESDLKINRFPEKRDIYLNNVSFQYEGPHSPYVLKDIDLHIPMGKVTAVVGTSGSGKTTMLKLIMAFYKPVSGEIIIGDTRVSNISYKILRTRTGAVMQNGYLFPDTIARNIAPGSEEIVEERINYAASVSNIRGFIESLPLGYNTKIGANGHGLSEGQKQRILIARVVYKNPDIVLFDEATNSLDAANEKAIVENLAEFFKDKTVVVVAHRLSTVKNADQIIVMDNGRIVETGTHETLSALRGVYYNLVKNQLELGN